MASTCDTPLLAVAAAALAFVGMHTFAGYATLRVIGARDVPVDESTQEAAKRRTCQAINHGTTAVVTALVVLSLFWVGRVCFHRGAAL